MTPVGSHQSARPLTLTHDALLYRTPGDYISGLVPFLIAGIEADEPTFVAVPKPNADLIREGLGATATAVTFADMTSVGRNPARIIPTIRHFLDDHPASHVRFIGEPIWAARKPDELCEATRHEAMLNTAFADTAVHIRCPYDAGRLDPAVLADSWRTHPTVLDGDDVTVSMHYGDPALMYRFDDALSAAPPPDLHTMAIHTDDLTEARQFVRHFSTTAGLAVNRVADLVLAANEIATNTLVHSRGPGALRLWQTSDAIVCEIADGGQITDPFIGRRSPDVASDHGRGVWMANQLCDLVQIRSSAAGTIVRLHVGHPCD
jgi:anti-sigma regulatory factor (Ser/Thr protein kinase)